MCVLLTCDVPGLPDAAVEDDVLLVAVLLKDRDLDDLPAGREMERVMDGQNVKGGKSHKSVRAYARNYITGSDPSFHNLCLSTSLSTVYKVYGLFKHLSPALGRLDARRPRLKEAHKSITSVNNLNGR